MNDDSSGHEGMGSDPQETDARSRGAESAELIRMIVEGFEPVDPDPEVWRRIDRQLWRSEGSRRRTRPAVYLAAAAAVFLMIGMTGVLVNFASREASDAPPPIELQATVVRDLSDPATGDVELTIHTDSDGSSIAVAAGSLPVLDVASTYQLWSVVGDEVVSVGVFGQSIASAPLRLEGDPAVLALTIETTGGVAVSTAEPVAVWTATG